MDRILGILALRQNELPRLLHAGAIFFMVAVTDGIVKSVAAAVFNIRVGVEQLPLMYSWIAILFSLSMAVLFWLSSAIKRRRLLFVLMWAVYLLLLCNTGILWFGHHWDNASIHSAFYSFLFISTELARSLAGFQIWIVAGGICYTSRAKVLFPLLAASTIIGESSGGFAVRFLSPLMASYQLYALGLIILALAIFALRPLVRRYFVSIEGGEQRDFSSLKENLIYFFHSNYLRLLFLLSIVVFALYTAIHYGFNVVVRENCSTEAEIASFFGLFYGTTGIGTLLVTTFLLRLFLRWLGAGQIYLWVCMFYALIGLVFIVSADGALGMPEIYVIFVFNLVNFIFLDSVIAPTYQVLMKMVPQRHSDGTRMIMEGGFALLGGLLGAGLTYLHARELVSLVEFFSILMIISGGVVIFGWKFKKSYTQVLIRMVREQDIDVDDAQAMASLNELISKSAEFSRSLLQHSNDGVRQMGIEILRQNPGPVVQEVCLALIEHENHSIRAAALEALGNNPEGLDEEILRRVLARLDDAEEDVRLNAARALSRLLGIEENGGSRMSVGSRAHAAVIEVIVPRLSLDARPAALRAEFLAILAYLQHRDSAAKRHAELATLLNSEMVDEIIAGVQAVGRIGEQSLYPQLLEKFKHSYPSVREAAVENLRELGHEGIFEALLGMLADPDPDVVEAVIRQLGRVGDERHWHTMIGALKNSNLREWQGLLGALIELGREELIALLMASCRDRLVEANRYLVAIDLLERQGLTPALEVLRDQLEGQNEIVKTGAIRLLGSLGDVDVVSDLLDRLSEDQEEARENAIELLENIADSELMRCLLPLIEDDIAEKKVAAKALCGWDIIDPDKVFEYLLESADSWTQMATVWALGDLDKLYLLEKLSTELAPQVGETIIEMRSQSGGLDMAAEDLPLTTMEKITFLKQSSFFAALPLEELYHIALTTEEESMAAATTVIEEGSQGDKMYIVVRGNLEVRKFGDEDAGNEGKLMATLEEREVFGDMALIDDEPRSASVIAVEDVRLLSLQRRSLERLLRRYSSIAFNMMQILSQRLRDNMGRRTEWSRKRK